jgi:dihydrofolate synthase/folylpolyglutamate synthase
MGVMEDKDHDGLLAAFEPYLEHVVCTQNSTPRSLSAAALGRAAVEVFGEDRVSVVPDLADAIDRAATLAEAGEAINVSIGAGAVLVTGSVVTVGEARSLLKGRR